MYQMQVPFGEAVKRALTENYCKFTGRASRSEYWNFVLFNFILSFAASMISFGNDTVGAIVSGVISLALLLPSLGLCIRRLHDTNHSGWWLLISLIPLVGAIVLIVFMCQESEMTENQYGPVPNMTA